MKKILISWEQKLLAGTSLIATFHPDSKHIPMTRQDSSGEMMKVSIRSSEAYAMCNIICWGLSMTFLIVYWDRILIWLEHLTIWWCLRVHPHPTLPAEKTRTKADRKIGLWDTQKLSVFQRYPPPLTIPNFLTNSSCINPLKNPPFFAFSSTCKKHTQRWWAPAWHPLK